MKSPIAVRVGDSVNLKGKPYVVDKIVLCCDNGSNYVLVQLKNRVSEHGLYNLLQVPIKLEMSFQEAAERDFP
jgi:hypothetical protein